MEVAEELDNSRDQVLVQMGNQYQGMLLRMCYVNLRDRLSMKWILIFCLS